MEIMNCNECGGAFLEDHGKCTCDDKLRATNEKYLKALKDIEEITTQIHILDIIKSCFKEK